MSRGSTVYLYELAWIIPSVAIAVGMLVALVVFASGDDVRLPGDEGRVNPTTVMATAPFDRPGIVQVGPGHYEARIVAGIWLFTPNEIRVPAGSTVTFVMTSRDVVHGLLIPRVNVNVMLLPGQITRATARFENPGEYPFFCHEYCGIAHHTMWGKVIVEPASNANRPDGDWAS